MNKSELLSTYTAEQLAEMVFGLQESLSLKMGKCEILEDADVIKTKCDKCGEEFIALLDNEHILCTKAELFATREANKQLNRDVAKLQSEVAKYRKAFEEAKKERDCQVMEYHDKIDKLNEEVRFYKEVFEKSKRVYEREVSECNKKICHLEKRTVVDFLPIEPIKIADMLIDNATAVYENYVEDFAKSHSGELVIGNPCEDVRRQTFSYLRQIAEHLLVYCNANEEPEE